MPTPAQIASRTYREIRQTPRFIKMPRFNGVAANSTTNALLPVGNTYLKLWLFFSIATVAATEAQIIAQVTNIELTLDNEQKIQLTGTEADMLANYYGSDNALAAVGSGFLPIFFHRPWQRTLAGEDGPAWGTQDVQSFNARVSLGAGATIDLIEATAEQTGPEELGRHLCIRRLALTSAAAGFFVVDNFIKDITHSTLALHIDKATITDIQVKADQVIEMDGLYGLYKQASNIYGRVPQSAFTHIDFARRNRLQDALPMVMQDLQVRLNFSGAPSNFNVLIERLEGIGADG